MTGMTPPSITKRNAHLMAWPVHFISVWFEPRDWSNFGLRNGNGKRFFPKY